MKNNIEKKRNLKHAKSRLNEQIKEKVINKKIDDSLEIKVESHSELSSYSVITNGIQNNYEQAEIEYQEAKANFIKNKSEQKKIELKRKKRIYKIEKNKIKDEVKQIFKLNNSSKGKIKILLNEKNSIELKNIGKFYATKGMIFEALKDVNLEFKKGSFNVILGPSGSGKTTLLNIISGLDRATRGTSVINGTNIQALSTRQITQFRRHNIGFVFQSYNLLNSLNVKDNIEVGRSLQIDKKKRKNISNLLEDMDMKHNKNKMTYELSGGQQQRVSIARALSKTPNVLIGDEPTGALDEKTSSKVFELFQKINKEFKTTIIIVTHNPKVALLGDQVIHVKDGKIEKVTQNKKAKLASQVFI